MEQRQQLGEANAEAQVVRSELQQLQRENEALKRDGAEMEESQEAMRRAVQQLRVADDLVVGLRRKAAQEAEAHAACVRELAAVRREVGEQAAWRMESSALSKGAKDGKFGMASRLGADE